MKAKITPKTKFEVGKFYLHPEEDCYFAIDGIAEMKMDGKLFCEPTWKILRYSVMQWSSFHKKFGNFVDDGSNRVGYIVKSGLVKVSESKSGVEYFAVDFGGISKHIKPNMLTNISF